MSAEHLPLTPPIVLKEPNRGDGGRREINLRGLTILPEVFNIENLSVDDLSALTGLLNSALSAQNARIMRGYPTGEEREVDHTFTPQPPPAA